MKIVINDCYGGFSLSHKAVMRYAELKGIKLYPWVDDISKSVYGDRAFVGSPERGVIIHYTTIPESEYIKLEEGEKQKPVGKDRYEKTNAAYFSERDISRTDNLLIQVIKELGKEADGHCAKLKVVEIPDDIEWEIEEYDGIEWVAEKHRTWRQEALNDEPK